MSDFTADAVLKGKKQVPLEEVMADMREACRDAEWFQLTVKGRNGRKFKFRYAVPKGFALDTQETAEFDSPQESEYRDYRLYTVPPQIRRRFLGITMRPWTSDESVEEWQRVRRAQELSYPEETMHS